MAAPATPIGFGEARQPFDKPAMAFLTAMVRPARLWRWILLLPALVAAQMQPLPAESAAFQPPPGQLCRAAIVTAEQTFNIPRGLLGAIGQVESGRPDPSTGAFLPWPWTVDADGDGHFYATKAEAIAAVRAFQASGIQSIDVGCMQINLLHHPQAFASLDEAFDPPANAAYAAHFLNELHADTGNWAEAAAFYHSTTPALASAYERQVMAAWPASLRQAAGVSPMLPTVYDGTRLVPPPMLATAGPFSGHAGAFMLANRPLHAPAHLPLVFGPPRLDGRGLDAYRRNPVLMASEALNNGN